MENNKWHQKWWGIVFLVILALILVIGLFYVYQIFYYLDNYKKGNYSVFSPDVINPNLYNNTGTNTTNQVEIATKDDPAFGPADAKVVVVEFQNFLCPHCQEAYPIMTKLISEYKDRVRFIFRDFPVEYAFPGSEIAAQASQCANDQGKFWEYSGLIYNNQANISEDVLKSLAAQLGLDQVSFNNCLTTKKYYPEVMLDLQAGASLGISATPTFFIQGVKVSGVIPYNRFKQVLDEQLELVK